MKEQNSLLYASRREIVLSGGIIGIANLVTDPLSPRQKAIIVGDSLGDGHLQLATNEKSARLRFTHSYTQASYVRWKYDNLGWLCEKVKPPYKTETKSGYTECIGYTSYQRELLQYHNLFYKPTGLVKPRFRKIIPADIDKHLKDPLSLMVLYLDDGTLRTDCNACRLATHSFTYEENQILRDCLKENFNIESIVQQWPATKWSLSIPARGGHSKKFLKLFEETVRTEIPSMRYKIERFPSI